MITERNVDPSSKLSKTILSPEIRQIIENLAVQIQRNAFNVFVGLEGVLEDRRSDVAKATMPNQIAWIKNLKDKVGHDAVSAQYWLEDLPVSQLVKYQYVRNPFAQLGFCVMTSRTSSNSSSGS